MDELRVVAVARTTRSSAKDSTLLAPLSVSSRSTVFLPLMVDEEPRTGVNG